MMEKKAFQKPAITIEEQITLLKSRGMVFQNEDTATHVLLHTNYYRLTAYWLLFEESHNPHIFCMGTTFEQVVNLYQFDQNLRKLLLEAITEIEISLRSLWAYHLALHYGSHAHLNSNLFTSQEKWKNNVDKLKEELRRTSETFIFHFKNTYKEDTPPIWVSSEIMSLGLLSRFYTTLHPMVVRGAISKTYKLDESVLESWLHVLTILRNKCAHHSRVWNCEFTLIPKKPKKIDGLTALWQSNRRIYNTLLLIIYLLSIIKPSNTLKTDLLMLINQYNINPNHMGFPRDYQNSGFWQ